MIAGHIPGNMLGCNLEVTGDMVLADQREIVAVVRHHEIKADTGADEDLLHARESSGGLSSSSHCCRWLVSSVVQAGLQCLSRQAPAFSHGMQSSPYMFAVGPPTSCTMPLNSFIFVIRVTSRTIDAMLRLWMIRPW